MIGLFLLLALILVVLKSPMLKSSFGTLEVRLVGNIQSLQFCLCNLIITMPFFSLMAAWFAFDLGEVL